MEVSIFSAHTLPRATVFTRLIMPSPK